MPFDLKKECKECCMPKDQPEFVTIEPTGYIAVRGKGDPSEEGGECRRGMGILYAVAYTIEVSYKGPYKTDGFSEYMVPSLGGFWWQDDVSGVDYSNKSNFSWISMIRLPNFVKKKNFDWAVREAEGRKKLNCSLTEYPTIDGGLYVQVMHHGAYDEEPAIVARMDRYVAANDCKNDLSVTCLHHGIYPSDPRKTEASRRKTAIRCPVEMGTEEIPKVYIERQEDVRK